MKKNPFEIYKSPLGREYRVYGIAKVENSEKWINRVLKYHWIVTIKYLDDKGGVVNLFYDYNDKLYKKEPRVI